MKILSQTSARIGSSALALLIAAQLGVTSLNAQSFQAQVAGVVRDPSGAVVVGAKLRATAIATGVVFTAESNEAGLYRFQSLPPTEYKVNCTMKGFKTFEQQAITLQVNQVLELNVTLLTGDVTEQITVSAAPPPLETESSTQGQIVTTRSIENLPLNIRDPMALVGLTPGVTFGGNFGNGGGSDVGRNFMKSDFNVGGGRSGSQEILLDGAPNTTPDQNRAIINPPVDSVQEFKVQVNSFDAQFGRTSGGVINIISRSGASQFHGVSYDFERHSVLDANNWFNNAAGKDLASFQRHQFGGNLGGPILKDKWFFFGDYEGLRQGYPSSTFSTVPSELQKQGNFSQTFTSAGAMIGVYDPNTLATSATGTRTRNPFPGNIIPGNRFDSVSSNTLGFYPAANLPGNAVTGTNNYIYADKSITNSDKWDIRSDANFTDRTRMFARYSHQEDKRLVPGSMPLPIGGGRNTTDTYSQAVVNLTHVINSAMFVDAQTSFSRGLAYQFGLSRGFDVSKLGFPASYVKQVDSQFPAFSISDVLGTSNGSDSFVQYQPRNVWATRGSVNYLHGRHSIKFGADWRALHFNEGQNTSASGIFGFGRTFTQGPNPIQSSATSGYGFASFLIGAATSGYVRQMNPISTQASYYGVFVHDDWRVSDRLTLNYGVRWEASTGDREKYNRLAYLDLGAQNPLGAKAGLPNLLGQLGWIGGSNPANQQNTDWNNFGPRIGFAYSLSPKTVLRGGYGIYFLPRSVQGNGDGAIEAFRDTSMVTSIDGLTPTNTISNPFPQGILPALNDRDPLANIGSSIAAPTLNSSRVGYTQNWSLDVQRELPAGLVFDAHYWGSRSVGLPVTWGIDQLPNQYLALGSKLNDTVANPFYGLISTGALSGTTISRQQSLLPYPQYTSISQVLVPNASSTYHAGTVQVEKRLSTKLTLLAAYTFSKAIDDVRTPLDVYNRGLEKGLSGFHTPHQLLLSGVYQLPFGRGRSFGSNMNPILNAIVGGWDLNGVMRIQSGNPVSVGRPSVNNGKSAKLDNPTINKWFDTTAFSSAPAYTFGNVGPVLPDVLSDALKNVDGVLVKNVAFHVADHAVTGQFRAEFYNVLNSVQFGSPNGTLTSANFGRVTSQANNPREIQFGLKFKF